MSSPPFESNNAAMERETTDSRGGVEPLEPLRWGYRPGIWPVFLWSHDRPDLVLWSTSTKPGARPASSRFGQHAQTYTSLCILHPNVRPGSGPEATVPSLERPMNVLPASLSSLWPPFGATHHTLPFISQSDAARRESEQLLSSGARDSPHAADGRPCSAEPPHRPIPSPRTEPSPGPRPWRARGLLLQPASGMSSAARPTGSGFRREADQPLSGTMCVV
jgi:hypothetical protein